METQTLNPDEFDVLDIIDKPDIVIDEDDQEEEQDDDNDELYEPSAVPSWCDDLVDNSFASASNDNCLMTMDVNRHDTSIIACGGMNDKVVIYRRNEDKMELECDMAFGETVTCLKFSPSGEYLGVGLLNGHISIYDCSSDMTKPVVEFEGPGADLEWFKWHKSSRCIMAGFGDGCVWLWVVPTGTTVACFFGHGAAVTCGEFINDDKMAVTGSSDGSLIVWNLKTQSQTFYRKDPSDDASARAIVSLSAHPTEPAVIIGGENNCATIINVDTGKVMHKSKGFTDTVETVAWFPDESVSTFAIGSLDGTVHLVNSATEFRIIHTLAHTPIGIEDSAGERGGITKLMWIVPQDSTITGLAKFRQSKLLTLGLDGTARVWSMANEDPVILSGHRGPIQDAVVFEEEGQIYIYTCGDDGMVKGYKL